MIGKGRFFDIISRTADDVNNAETNIATVIRNFDERTIKREKQLNRCNDMEK